MKVNIYNDNNNIVDRKINEKISVIIPNYNYSKYIIERIDSILLQSVLINELIILDDASTDNSVEVIEDKIEKIKIDYPKIKIKFIKNEINSGGCVFAQWQKGLKAATGDYIWIAEADDSSNNMFLENILKLFKQDKEVILAYSESMVIDEENNIKKDNCRDWCDIFNTGRWNNDFINDGKDEIINYLSCNNTILNVSSVIFKNNINLYDIFEEAKKFKIAGDWFIYVKILEHGKIAFSKSPLNYFRKHKNSVSTLDIRDNEYIEVYKIQEYIRKKYNLDELQIKNQRIRRKMMGYIENNNNLGKKGNIAWFVPALLKGSGGHRTIFQNVNALIKNGYHCDVYIGDFNRHTPNELYRMINDYYGEFNGDVFSDWNKPLKEYDVCVATAYNSAPIVNKIDCPKKMYFIQDFEPYFFPIGTEYIVAENTYKYNFYGITIGKWLSHKMRNEYNLKTNYFHFCADLNVYHKLDKINKENAICLIFQPDKPRRCDLIALKALQIVQKIQPDVKIYTFGSQPCIINNLLVEQLGIIPIEKCNELYNKCSVGLCMSASNPSRIPFEMMASGLPVVELYRDNNLYDFPNDGVLLADSTPEALATALLKILNDKKMQEEMSNSGSSYMKNYPLEKGYEEFLNAFDDFYNNRNTNSDDIKKYYKKNIVLADEKIIDIAKKLPEISYSNNNNNFSNISFFKRFVRKIKKIIKNIIVK